MAVCISVFYTLKLNKTTQDCQIYTYLYACSYSITHWMKNQCVVAATFILETPVSASVQQIDWVPMFWGTLAVYAFYYLKTLTSLQKSV